MSDGKPPKPVHQKGTSRGEELARKQGSEPGRKGSRTTPRYSTGINPDKRKPIDPSSPYLPPA